MPVDPEHIKRLSDALCDAAGPSTIAICGGYPDRPDAVDLVGSGVLLEIADMAFIITAAHVAWTARQTGVLCFVPGVHGDSVLLDGLTMHYSGPEDDQHERDHRDVAIIVLRGEQVDALKGGGFSFVRQTEIDANFVQRVSTPATFLLGLYGYPAAARVQEVDTGTKNAQSRHFGLIMTHAAGVAWLDDRIHLALGYSDPESPDRWKNGLLGSGQACHPKGLSGCGVWAVAMDKIRTGDVAGTDFRLVGIQHTWIPTNGPAVATRIGLPLLFMLEHYRGLERAMALHLRPDLSGVLARPTFNHMTL